MGKVNVKIMNKKALSPIFATLIILAVVTVLFIPVFIWATGMTSSTQDSWLQSGITATERIVVEEASFSSSDQPPPAPPGTNAQSGTIYVRDIGETVITINDVIISAPNSAVHVYQKTGLITINPITGLAMTTVTKGNLIQINIPRFDAGNAGFRIVNGTTYTIKVYTTRGVFDTYQVVAR